jgi:hypothetical protein
MSTGSSTSISSTYILFLTKLQKKQIPEKRFTQIEKRYHTNFYINGSSPLLTLLWLTSEIYVHFRLLT